MITHTSIAASVIVNTPNGSEPAEYRGGPPSPRYLSNEARWLLLRIGASGPYTVCYGERSLGPT